MQVLFTPLFICSFINIIIDYIKSLTHADWGERLGDKWVTALSLKIIRCERKEQIYKEENKKVLVLTTFSLQSSGYVNIDSSSHTYLCCQCCCILLTLCLSVCHWVTVTHLLHQGAKGSSTISASFHASSSSLRMRLTRWSGSWSHQNRSLLL